MAIPILNHLDLRSVSELQNAILHTTTHTAATNKAGAIIYDTGSSTLKYCTGTSNSDWISLTGDTNTWRTVTVDTSGNGSADNTLETSETLMLKKGTNITLAEALGVVTISSTDTTYSVGDGGLTTNDFTNADHSKLNAIEAAADVTDATNVTAAGALMDSELTTIALVKGLTAGISDGNVLTANDVVANNDFLRIDGTEVEGLTAAEVVTALGIEASATADQSNAEIVAAVEAGTDSNTFTNADHTKLNAIEAGADVTDTANVTSAGALMDSELAGIAAVKATTGTFLTADQTKLDTIETSADVTDTANVKTALGAAMPSNTLAIGNSSTVTTIAGELIVTGDTTYHNETIQIVENNTISFEGTTADVHEIHLTSADATADRTITLPDTTGTVALTSDIGNGTLTVEGTGALGGSGTFTANQAGNTTISISHDDTSSQASVDNSGRAYIQDITLDTYGHVTSLTSATETVVNTNTQLATAASLIDVSAMAGNNNANIEHDLGSINLVVQLYDTTSGLTVMADIDHIDNDNIRVTFSQTGTQMVASSIGDIRVVVIDAKNGLSDITPTYS